MLFEIVSMYFLGFILKIDIRFETILSFKYVIFNRISANPESISFGISDWTECKVFYIQ